MAFVVDASVAVAWAFDEEDHPTVRQAAARLDNEEGVAPSLWWFEVRNALILNERRGRLRLRHTAEFLRVLARLPISIDYSPIETDVLEIARRHRLTVYDASYLELACRIGAPLLTLDRALANAAAAEGVTGDSR